ncbi:MAG: Glu-tRNA(Gln) amidotransferase subunit GatE [Thermoplasmatota archaeon]
MDYEQLGLRAGLEIHQQLDVGKLFCGCPSEVSDAVDYTFRRQLTPTRSELGDVDRAALAEARRQRRFVYHASDVSTCLVEADEEPPHPVNEAAVDVCLTMALLLDARVVDEIPFMRKIVVDGSNTAGFQRTGLVAMDGMVDNVGIETICLEEDAARLLEGRDDVAVYGLDRLGIPLVEIATAPDITTPEQAMRVAERIGRLFRATGQVRRGIGTIRQDVNVSIEGGSRVEIKGVQELRSIAAIVRNEVARQRELLAVADRLRKLSSRDRLDEVSVEDVSTVFADTGSKIVARALEDGVVMAARLPGFAGLLGGVSYEEGRLGNELASHAELAGGGIMHSDELPAYGISGEEVRSLRAVLDCGDRDAFVLSVGPADVARRSLEAALERATRAFDGVPGEVRRALPDETTRYMRPMPGAERMYPETDVPPVAVTARRLARVADSLPERPEHKVERYVSLGLSREEAGQLVSCGHDAWFEGLVERYPGEAKTVARVLLHMVPEVERETGMDVEREMVDRVLSGVHEERFSREGVPRVLGYLADHPDASLGEAMAACDLETVDEAAVRDVVEQVVDDNMRLVEDKGEHAVGALMGIAMEELRGRADGALVHRLLSAAVEKRLDEP